MQNHLLAAAIMGMPLVLEAQPGSTPLRLSLGQAVAAALTPGGDARPEIAEARLQQAQAQLAEVRSALAPQVETYMVGQGQTRSFDAFGLGLVQFPLPGFSFPAVVGPFGTIDARIAVRQDLFDASARGRVLRSPALRQPKRAPAWPATR